MPDAGGRAQVLTSLAEEDPVPSSMADARGRIAAQHFEHPRALPKSYEVSAIFRVPELRRSIQPLLFASGGWQCAATKARSRSGSAARAELTAAIVDQTASWLNLTDVQRRHLAASDHVLDAVLSAIVGRLIAIGETLPIPPELRGVAPEGGLDTPTAT